MQIAKNGTPKNRKAIVHDISKSARALKCLIIIVKSLKTKIVHTVTKGIARDVHVRKKIVQRRVNAWVRGIL